MNDVPWNNLLYDITPISPQTPLPTVLLTTYPTWTFQNAQQHLPNGELVVKTYEALGNNNLGGGAVIDVHRQGQQGGPTGPGHWIQIWTEYRYFANGQVSTTSKVDSPSLTSPWFDSRNEQGQQGTATVLNFFDRPRREVAGLTAITWQAELYYAEGVINMNTATLWDGFRWGFGLQEEGGAGGPIGLSPMTISPVPEPSSILLCGVLAVVGSGYALKRRKAA
jgi:hypothetical protein